MEDRPHARTPGRHTHAKRSHARQAVTRTPGCRTHVRLLPARQAVTCTSGCHTHAKRSHACLAITYTPGYRYAWLQTLTPLPPQASSSCRKPVWIHMCESICESICELEPFSHMQAPPRPTAISSIPRPHNHTCFVLCPGEERRPRVLVRLQQADRAHDARLRHRRPACHARFGVQVGPDRPHVDVVKERRPAHTHTHAGIFLLCYGWPPWENACYGWRGKEERVLVGKRDGKTKWDQGGC